MDTYLKLGSVKNDTNCNCISPFYINGITGINPNTKRDYSPEDLDAMKTALYRISAAKGCNVSVCCDPNDPTTSPDSEFTKQFIRAYPKIMPIYQGNQLQAIKLSTSANVKESGWQEPTTHMICKITKATITNTSDPTIKMASNLVNDCYSDSCSSLETMTVNTLLQNAKADMTYSYVDDARVSQAILENNSSYVKEYIRKYKGVNFPLTNDDYNNRLIHIAAGSGNNDILTMLIALKANLNIQNKLRETPIHLATKSANLDNISSLLSQGVDLTIPNNNGETPMFYAMKTGDLRIINMLYTNNSPIQGMDKNGNNLIHYCVLHCPSYKEDDNTVPNTKSEIIQFLIDHGISTEQKNNAGITPLEIVSKQINKEVNKECSLGIKKDNDNIIEKFFSKEHFSSANSGTGLGNTLLANSGTGLGNTLLANNVPLLGNTLNQQISQYTPEHLSLLDIQTKLFNNIIQNNPNKYSDYISVDDIPSGAPIQILDTVCVGANMTGNEDSDECIAKGGQIVKVKNKTTKIKLDLIAGATEIDALNQNDLYFPKSYNKIPKGTVPINVANYNANVKSTGNVLPNTQQTQQTQGITYNLGASSTNALLAPNAPNAPNATGTTPTAPIPHITPNAPTPAITTAAITDEHPSMFEDDNDVVHKCKRDAINNSIKIATTPLLTGLAMQSDLSTLTTPSVSAFMNTISDTTDTLDKYKISISILAVIIILLIGYLIYSKIKNTK
jgi:ankyrin repeat protein